MQNSKAKTLRQLDNMQREACLHADLEFIAAQTTASDAASLLPPETIDSYTSQYSSKSSKARGGYEAYNTTQDASSVRPTNLIVAEDGTVRRAQKT